MAIRTTRYRSFVTLACALLAASLSPTASAQSMHNEQALIDGAAYSANYPNTFWVQADRSDGGVTNFSGVRLNDHFGLTVGHGFFEDGIVFSNHRIGNGSNWMTDPGDTYDIIDSIVHPGWAGSSFVGSQVDLAIVRFDSAWEGDDVTIGTANIGDLVTYSGFGRPATPGLGLLPADGERRAFQQYVENFGGPGGIYSDDYFRGRFYPPGSSNFLELGGQGTFGTSGAGAWNESGELIGLISGGSINQDYFTSTYSLDLSLYADWITANTVVPAPGAGALLGVGLLFGAARRRQGATA